MYRTVRGLRGFVGQRKPRFPYGLGGSVGQRRPSYPYGLGCECKKALGQDDSGVQPLFASDADWQGTPVGPALPSGAFTMAAAAPSDLSWLQSNAISEALNTPAPPSASTTTASASSLSSYLPYIALGLGAVVLISAVKRR